MNAQIDITLNPIGVLWGDLSLGVVNAQIDADIDPMSILLGEFSLSSDFGVSEDISFETMLGIGSENWTDGRYSTLNLTLNGKYYFNPTASSNQYFYDAQQGADRFYAFTFVRYTGRRNDYDNNTIFVDYTKHRVALGLGLGAKVVSNRRIIFDIHLGGGRTIMDETISNDNNSTQIRLDWQPIMLTGKLALGYRF